VLVCCPRRLTRADVAEELNVTDAQVYALIRRGDLRAIKIGGRGVHRVERSELEAFIQRLYEKTVKWIEEHPFDEDDEGT
jgi:excisionase family DNA binding protein